MSLSTARWFRLAPCHNPSGISCNECGAFVGRTPLLAATSDAGGRRVWKPRPTSDLNAELSSCYGLPVDLSTKEAGVAAVARALNRGDVAHAQCVTLLLHLPDPPPIGQGVRSLEDTISLAALIHGSGILKGEWDADKHPRTGVPPNPGWFAPVEGAPKPPKPGWPSSRVNEELRTLLKRVAKQIAERGPLALGGPVGDFILAFLEIFSSTELNQGEDRIIAQSKAYFDPPKTLEELQSAKCDGLGYETHHIVEQHDANRERFGDDAIDDPSNVVCIPRLKHEEISGYYNSRLGGPGTPTVREKLSEKSFEEQREEGLRILRERGVLK